jgi:predicted helicase
VFHYAYAVFHSPGYRERYAEFLKIDFPRLPLTGDVALFRELCGYGEALVQWHLLTHPDKDKGDVSFPEGGSNEVLASYPKYENGCVFINKSQYFSNVSQAVWDFHIGGYQVLEKWLKDRKGRKLDYKEIEHYEQVVKALEETISLMDKIDAAIPSWPLV